jgi:hypothetical protein
MLPGFEYGEDDDCEYNNDFLDTLGYDIDDDGMISDEYALGTIRQQKLNQMIEAQTMIARTGWLEIDPAAKQEKRVVIPTLEPLNKDPDVADPKDLLDIDPLLDGPLKYGKMASEWKAEVKNARQRLQELKLANCPATLQSNPLQSNSTVETTALTDGIVKLLIFLICMRITSLHKRVT